MPTILWDAVTLNQDGSPLTDLSGYKVYHGTAPGVYDTPVTVGAGVTTYNSLGINEEVNNYYTVSAVSASNGEGLQSNVIVWENRSPQNRVPVRYIKQFV